MLKTFTRINPNEGPLQPAYRAYQQLVGDYANWYHPPHPELPVEVSHLQSVGFLKAWNDTPGQRKHLEKIDRFIEDKGVVNAAGELALELVERAQWLLSSAPDVQKSETPQKGPKQYGSQKGTVPLEINGPFTDATARIELLDRYERLPGTRTDLPYPHLVSVQINGLNTDLDKKFWTYADISDELLHLGRPDSTGTSVSGTSLARGFGLRDMLTFVENNAPLACLPKVRYPAHIGRLSLSG